MQPLLHEREDLTDGDASNFTHDIVVTNRQHIHTEEIQDIQQ